MMKRTHKGLTRLLSAGLSLALLTTLLPGAMAATSGSLSKGYTMDSTDELEIDYEDFNDYCDGQVDEIRFSNLPDSDDGTLYYYFGYGKNDYEAVKEKRYIAYEDFYGLLFVPENDFDGIIEIDFSGYDEDGYDFDGTIEIDVRGDDSDDYDADDITYTVAPNRDLELKVKDFVNACDDATRDDLYRIRFTDLPRSSYGVLYLDYDCTDAVEEDEWYYYEDDELDELTFAADDHTGKITLPYDGEADDGTRFTGAVVITVSSSGSSATAKTGDVPVYTDTNKSVYLDVADFDDFVYEDTDDSDEVSYLMFTSLPDKDEGVLWYEDVRDDRKVDEDESFDHDDIDYVYFVP